MSTAAPAAVPLLYGGLALVPAIAILIAVLDRRIGFQLFMASAALVMIALIAGLVVRRRVLRTGVVTMAAEGVLHFRPGRLLVVAEVSVAIAMGLPALVTAIITARGLPTQEGLTRFTTLAPYVLGALSIGLLVRALLSLRTPPGLRIDAEGLRGVRGSAVVEVRWDELAGARAEGRSGPRLEVDTRAGGSLSVDAHHLGSDPALVAAVIEFYRTQPGARGQLADGAAALAAVEAAAAR